MTNNKVLFISPTPTHATTAGNRLHIKSMISFFREVGWDVHFLYLAYEDYHDEAMRTYFGNNLHIISKGTIYQNRKTINYVFKKFLGIINRLKRKWQFFFGRITKNQFLYNSEVDSHFSVFIKPKIKALQKQHDFKVVVCEYAFMSKSLAYFNKSVFKILDAHDSFTDRFNMYLNRQLKPSWVSLYKNEERKALRRADLIIALKKKEKQFFEQLSGKKSICFFSMSEVVQLPAKNFEKKLLYFASDNPVNVETLKYFEDKVLPLVTKTHPDVLLLVGGTICNSYVKKNSNLQLLGKFDTAFDFYKLGDIVINPELEGTGLKIKTLEALCFGMPVVCTMAGAAGLTDDLNNHLLIANTNDQLAKAIIEIIENESLRKRLIVKAKNWIMNNQENMKMDLLNIITNRFSTSN